MYGVREEHYTPGMPRSTLYLSEDLKDFKDFTIYKLQTKISESNLIIGD